MLKEEFPETYESVITNELFSDIKEIVDVGKGTYKNKAEKETEIIKFSWDSLEYPKAFEDIYDPVWNS